MEKIKQRIGFLYPAFFIGEKTTLHTMAYTSEGRFIPESSGSRLLPESAESNASIKDAEELIRCIQRIQDGDQPYRLFIVDTYGGNREIMDALGHSGIPVVSMEDVHKALGGMNAVMYDSSGKPINPKTFISEE